jgi:hypothetical protein
MQAQTLTAADKRARQAAVRSRYAPRPAPRNPAAPVRETAADVQLRKLTAATLEALKNPSAIPSNVIMDALRQARALNVK